MLTISQPCPLLFKTCSQHKSLKCKWAECFNSTPGRPTHTQNNTHDTQAQKNTHTQHTLVLL